MSPNAPVVPSKRCKGCARPLLRYIDDPEPGRQYCLVGACPSRSHSRDPSVWESPYTIWSSHNEDTMTWWGPYDTVQEASRDLVIVRRHTPGAHIRNAFRKEVKP